jgi:hypothetical protein
MSRRSVLGEWAGVIDDLLRDLAARMARDPRIAASVVEHPETAVPRMGLRESDVEVLGALDEARTAYRLRHPPRRGPSG